MPLVILVYIYSYPDKPCILGKSHGLRGLVLCPCGKVNVIMTLVLVHEVLQLHCQQTLVLAVIMHPYKSRHTSNSVKMICILVTAVSSTM